MSSYREDRRADRAAERAQDREDRRLELEAAARREQLQAEEKRKDAEAKRRQEQADKKARLAERAAKKAAAAAKRAKAIRWLKANPATLFVAFVMVASIVPAILSQIGALTGASVAAPMAGLLAAMLEGGAWAITFMGKQAEDAGREPRKYRIGTWAVATVAAAVNFWHGLEAYGEHPWVAFVLGASSLFAIYIWDLKTHGSHGKTKADKARRAHVAARRKHHPQIVEQAIKLQAALPYGTLDDEAAFAAAWRIHTGAEPGLSAELYATATNAVLQLGAAFELGDNVRDELLETGFKAARLNPFTELTQNPTSQAGLGQNASQAPAPADRPEAPEGKTPEELEALLPDALAAAAELVAEGRQISAHGLAKKLQIRRVDAALLRNRVIEQRRLHVA
ncbi:hypothetical protein [Streptomyces cinereoruber]|uniref:hypothetical protein n=1 Tax=Streptomyces cinereoruber TaxID=67260 RepID=UPI003639CF16